MGGLWVTVNMRGGAEYGEAWHKAGNLGGLLVGVVEQQRPDLFAVALPEVGVMDMLRYDKFTCGPAWVTEYGRPPTPRSSPS